jgi:O-antigen ligase/tetratricopeptide (TPR) repeat protein
MSTNQLKALIVAGLFAVPFIPLIVAKSLFFPFITGKAFVFRVLVEIIFALWLLLALRDREYRPKFTWISGAVLLFLVAIGLADIFSENPFKSFWSNYERMEGFVGIAHFIAYFYVASSLLKSQQVWNKLLATSIGASVVMAIYAFFQLADKIAINQGGVRVDGTFGNASYLGIYTVFHIFFAALLYFRTTKIWQKVLLGISVLLNLIVLYNTATRGAILGLLGGALISIIYLAIRSEKGAPVRKIAWGGLVLIALIVGVFFAIKNTEYARTSPVLSRFTTLSLSEIRTQGRYYVWPIAWKGFLEKPVVGWGQESFNFVFNKYYNPEMYGQEPWFDRTHNVVLDWLVAGGLVGFLSYASIYAALLYYVFKKGDYLTREDKGVILGLVAAYTFHNLFVFDQIGSYILFFTLLGYINAHAPATEFGFAKKLAAPFRKIADGEGSKPVVEAGVVIAMLVVLYTVVVIQWQHNKNLLAVLRLGSQGTVGTAAQYLKPLNPSRMGYSEAIEHVSQAVISLGGNESAPEELRRATYEGVDNAFKNYIGRVPTDARYRLFYGVFLSSFGQYPLANEQFAKAAELSPNKQQILFQLANTQFSQGDKAGAVATAKRAYELAPQFEEANAFYGYMLLLSGDAATANQVLSKLPEEKLIFDDRYISILQQLGQYDKMIQVAKRRTEINAVNPQYKLNLAAAYLLANRRGEAIQILQQMIAADPSFKEQGEYFIKEIQAGRTP